MEDFIPVVTLLSFFSVLTPTMVTTVNELRTKYLNTIILCFFMTKFMKKKNYVAWGFELFRKLKVEFKGYNSYLTLKKWVKFIESNIHT